MMKREKRETLHADIVSWVSESVMYILLHITQSQYDIRIEELIHNNLKEYFINWVKSCITTTNIF